MNWGIHLTICVTFLFSTWVYFLKCEINELRRRLSEASGEAQAAAPVPERATVLHPSLTAVSAAHAGHAHPPVAAAPAHRGYKQGSGIPTWKID